MWSELLASTYVELLYDGSSASDYWLTRWVEVNASAIFSSDHESYAKAIKAHLDNPLASIEMVATQDEPHTTSIERALDFVSQAYGTTK